MNDFRKIFLSEYWKKEKTLDVNISSEFSMFDGIFPFNSALYIASYCDKVFVK